nr:ribonuclease H-like domain-containing protein [Tanacetum cinerariifolium]
MSWTGLPKFADDTITDYSRHSPSIESNSSDLQNIDSSISEKGDSLESIMSKPMIKFVKATDSPTKVKISKVETIRKPSVKYAEMYRNTTKSPKVRGNQRNWNNLKTQQLGKDFVMKNKACFKCGQFDHLAYDCVVWEEQGKIWPKNNNTHKSMSPINVFYKTSRQLMRTNRPNMNAAKPKRTSFTKPAHSYVRRPFQRTSAVRTQFRVPRVSTINTKFPIVNQKFPTGNSKLSTADLGNKGKAVNASACCIWKPKQNSTGKGPNNNNVSVIFKKYQYIDTQGRLNGCSRYMTGNISYLSDYEPYDGGYVSFGKEGGKITGKECIVLGRDFKLKDDTNMLRRTPRQHNMYSIDLNNIVPHKDLTCLVANATADESVLWHRRLGHLNFKTMNKLVRHNLVRGLPSKCFENDHTCVACLKGKQHKASCKTKLVHSMTKPLYTLHMDLFGPTSVSSLNRIKREFSNARTPQQNRVAKRRHKTLIKAARTMLADAKLLVTFWAKAVNTACYVQNRVL